MRPACQTRDAPPTASVAPHSYCPPVAVAMHAQALVHHKNHVHRFPAMHDRIAYLTKPTKESACASIGSCQSRAQAEDSYDLFCGAHVLLVPQDYLGKRGRQRVSLASRFRNRVKEAHPP